jgi:hypothetical protein
MATTTDIPVHITPEAAARIAELGMEREVQQMLDHTKQTVRGLESIGVTTWDSDSDPQGPAHLMLTGWRPGMPSSVEDLLPESEWGSWFVRAFPPQVAWWFIFVIEYRGNDERSSIP